MRSIKNERGVSLVEVVATVVIIAIVLGSFFTLIIRSNATSVSSNQIMNATYAAQQEMERIFKSSKSVAQYKTLYTSLNYSVEPESVTSASNEFMEVNGEKQYFDKKYSYTRSDSNFTYTMIVRSFKDNEKMFHVQIIAKDNKENREARMENVYMLGGTQ